MRSVFALSIAGFAGFCAAQSTIEQNYPYTIDPNTVSEADRQYWCSQNEAQCPLICLQQPGVTSMTTNENDCDPDALTYNCVCDNGIAPNITQYSQTLPFFICQAWGNNCVAACNGDNICQSACRSDHPCGAQNPYRGNTSIPTTMSSTNAPGGASATNTLPYTSFGATAAPTGTNNGDKGGAASAFMPSAGLGMAAIFGSVFLGFAVLL
ncbi:hypothetical protein EJ02DRAFT_459268 [Clathrospora elynae]|uniref:DUF7707 domain-containing protein n=1 Tax=Clathrospora elynae TaxID=706981 RepID=A0A6A5SB18_9PLEO|nr:hypothetical protein EJ02DRAFT_459268 [Clathrospora elynae]